MGNMIPKIVIDDLERNNKEIIKPINKYFFNKFDLLNINKYKDGNKIAFAKSSK